MQVSHDERMRMRAAQMAKNRRDSVFSCSNRAMKSDIILTLNQDDYTAGDVITGSVKIILTQEVKVKDLLLKINGHSRVSWDEQRTYTKGSAPTVSRRNTETYLEHVIVLLQKDAEEGVLIPPGDHVFHFEFDLPRNIPPTYSGKWGQIRYTVKSVLERPWKFDIEREKEFTVAANVDLNEEPELLRPVSALGEFRSGFLCFRGGLINVEVRLSRKAYIPGEKIPFQVVIENRTGRKLHDAKVSLMQHTIFRAGQKTKKISHCLVSASKGEISARNTDNWENDSLTIPQDAVPSTAKHINTIQTKYAFTLSISYSSWQDEFVFPVVIQVGTQSFRKAVVQAYLSNLGYTVTPRTSPCPSPIMGYHSKHNGCRKKLLQPPIHHPPGRGAVTR